MADFLDEKRKEIQARLKELKPAVEEYQLLEAAERRARRPRQRHADAPRRGDLRTRARAGAARRAAAHRHGSGRRGRPRGSGTRAAQALELVRDRPGITIPELAEAMGIKQNYLYRVHARPRRAGQGDQVRARVAPAGGRER